MRGYLRGTDLSIFRTGQLPYVRTAHFPFPVAASEDRHFGTWPIAEELVAAGGVRAEAWSRAYGDLLWET